ncbi:MAG: GNAT family N-acetyltransferase [Candidatus Heimdallarchaeota archaeon]|nr:GNAT family N-acetyltransferase [Candidatus Heimdallarchaeota archaeon]
MLQVVKLEHIEQKKFWDYVLSDVPFYFFFILDLKQYPEQSQFLVAIENEDIVGLCLIWKNQIAHLRGQNEKIIKSLFCAIPEDIPINQFNFEIRYQEMLSSLIPKPKTKLQLHRMVLQKDRMIPRFPLDKPFTQRKLTKEDSHKIAKLMAKASPTYWSKITSKHLTFDENQNYTGLFDGNKLISFTLAWIDETAAIIANAATHPKYQNLGLATYLVNESVHKMMEHTEIAIIHVLTDNKSAIKVYSKVGYEVYASFIMVGV